MSVAGLRQITEAAPYAPGQWSESQPPNDWYRSRLQRARIANLISRVAETEQTEEANSWQAAAKRLEGTTRVSELRARLRILAQRDETSWGNKEMKAALAASGVSTNGDVSRAELCSMVKGMAEKAVAEWEAEAANAIVAREIRATVEKKKEASNTIARKFRSLGARTQKVMNAGDDTLRTAEGDSSDEDAASTTRSSSSSHRATFRTMGATYASKAVPAESTQPDPLEEDSIRRVVRDVLIPEFAEETLWAHLVGRCLAPPKAL